MGVRVGAIINGSPPDYEEIVVPIQPDGPSNPLFLVPGLLVHAKPAMAEAQFYSYIQLVRSLGGSYPVYGLRTMGVDGLLGTQPSLEHLAAVYANAVRSLRPSGPYVIVGDCVGGIVAYEVARQLSIGADRVALVLFNTAYPGESRRHSILRTAQVRRRARVRLGARIAKAHRAWKWFIALDSHAAGRMNRLFGKGLSFLNYRRSAEYRFWKRYSLDLAHLWRLIWKYDPPAYHGDFTLLVTAEMLERGYVDGWEKVVAAGPRIDRIPGDHTNYLRAGAAVMGGIIANVADSVGMSHDADGEAPADGRRSRHRGS